jgi:hypothetical protein
MSEYSTPLRPDEDLAHPHGVPPVSGVESEVPSGPDTAGMPAETATPDTAAEASASPEEAPQPLTITNEALQQLATGLSRRVPRAEDVLAANDLLARLRTGQHFKKMADGSYAIANDGGEVLDLRALATVRERGDTAQWSLLTREERRENRRQGHFTSLLGDLDSKKHPEKRKRLYDEARAGGLELGGVSKENDTAAQGWALDAATEARERHALADELRTAQDQPSVEALRKEDVIRDLIDKHREQPPTYMELVNMAQIATTELVDAGDGNFEDKHGNPVSADAVQELVRLADPLYWLQQDGGRDARLQDVQRGLRRDMKFLQEKIWTISAKMDERGFLPKGDYTMANAMQKIMAENPRGPQPPAKRRNGNGNGNGAVGALDVVRQQRQAEYEERQRALIRAALEEDRRQREAGEAA